VAHMNQPLHNRPQPYPLPAVFTAQDTTTPRAFDARQNNSQNGREGFDVSTLFAPGRNDVAEDGYDHQQDPDDAWPEWQEWVSPTRTRALSGPTFVGIPPYPMFSATAAGLRAVSTGGLPNMLYGGYTGQQRLEDGSLVGDTRVPTVITPGESFDGRLQRLTGGGSWMANGLFRS